MGPKPRILSERPSEAVALSSISTGGLEERHGYRGERHSFAGALREYGGFEGHFEAPSPVAMIEARHGFAGARRAMGGVGGHFGAPNTKGPRTPLAGGRSYGAGCPGLWR